MPEALNLEILSVDGDSSFGTYVAYLTALHIPWAIVCDGPVLSREYQKRPLLEQLRHAKVLDNRVVTPRNAADFNRWSRFWERHRAYTLAREFGDLTGKSKSKRGEIEAYLRPLAPALWDEGGEHYSDNKPRRAHWFVQQIPCPAEVAQLYGKLVRLLVGPDVGPPMSSPAAARRRRMSTERPPAGEHK